MLHRLGLHNRNPILLYPIFKLPSLLLRTPSHPIHMAATTYYFTSHLAKLSEPATAFSLPAVGDQGKLEDRFGMHAGARLAAA